MTFDEERTAFFAAFGQALESWSSVEAHLYLIFLGCVSPAEHRVAAAIYYATVGFRTKLEITDAAVKVALEGQPELAEWEKLRERAWRKYSKRNELAHYDVLSDPQRVQGQRLFVGRFIAQSIAQEQWNISGRGGTWDQRAKQALRGVH